MAEWSSEAPTEPGWYWYRNGQKCLVFPVEVREQDGVWMGEFWPVRIEAPEEKSDG